MPDRIERFRQVDRSKNRPRTKPAFVKSIPSGLKKKQNLIESRPSKAETSLAGRENGV